VNLLVNVMKKQNPQTNKESAGVNAARRLTRQHVKKREQPPSGKWKQTAIVAERAYVQKEARIAIQQHANATVDTCGAEAPV
jgi:hypothetical protein